MFYILNIAQKFLSWLWCFAVETIRFIVLLFFIHKQKAWNVLNIFNAHAHL